LTTLIENGSDCRFKDRKQATPLHVAAEKGTSEQVELILQAAPCSVHERDLKGNTALHLAAFNRKRYSSLYSCAFMSAVNSCDLFVSAFLTWTPLRRQQ
jgi:ankyrin repeat protein